MNNKEEQNAVRSKIMSLFGDARDMGERRNAYMNLAWTGPIENTLLEKTYR